MNQSTNNEFEAFKTVHGALAPLDDEARSRVIKSIVSLLAIDVRAQVVTDETGAEEGADAAAERADEGAPTYSTFAELYAGANPTTNTERALVAGYWLQVCQGSESFSAQAANSELTHLGHKVGNITVALNSLKDTRPQLVLQLKKSGRSRQARKTYKVSQAGVQRVEEMIGG